MPNRTPKQQPAPHAAKDAKDVERMRLEHDLITDSGIVPATKGRHAIYCLTVIGTIEGHSLAPDNQKSTKYEHVIPQLVDIEEDPAIEGLLVILNTVGGDVEAGLALAELISGISKPSATLVLGGGHSIGIPLAVSARKSFIVPTATMTVHPVRHSGMVLGVPQTLLDQYGAVSEPTARAMAEGARRITGADIAVSVTGVAGPDPDERGNPVGLVFIGLATPDGTFCRRTESGRRTRDRIQDLAANHALDMVRRYLTGLRP